MFDGIALHGRVLQITGDQRYADTIVVGLTPDQGSIIATLQFTSPRTGLQTYTKTVPLSAKLKQVRITGGNGGDHISVDQTYGSFPIRTYIKDGSGNDTIIGGDEPDLIYGGAGADSIVGGAGNDSLYGENGNDTILGGAGNDFINGGHGHDVEMGGDGNDTLRDTTGPDTLIGGAGSDNFYVITMQNEVTDLNRAEDHLHYIHINQTVTLLNNVLNSVLPFGL